MNILDELYYTNSHEWIRFLDENTALIGISDYAQQQLGDIVFVNLIETGTEIQTGDTLGDVESVKAVSDVYSPLSGVIQEINEVLFEQPELINQDCYDAWFIKLGNIKNKEGLLTAEEYHELLKSEEH